MIARRRLLISQVPRALLGADHGEFRARFDAASGCGQYIRQLARAGRRNNVLHLHDFHHHPRRPFFDVR